MIWNDCSPRRPTPGWRLSCPLRSCEFANRSAKPIVLSRTVLLGCLQKRWGVERKPSADFHTEIAHSFGAAVLAVDHFVRWPATNFMLSPARTERMKNTAVLLSSSPIALARKGVMAAITQFLVAHNGSVLHADDHIDSGRELFLSRLEWDLDAFDIPVSAFEEHFRPVADSYH